MCNAILANTGKDGDRPMLDAAGLRTGYLLDCTFRLSRSNENADTSR